MLSAAPSAGPSLSPSEAEPPELEHFTPKSSSFAICSSGVTDPEIPRASHSSAMCAALFGAL